MKTLLKITFLAIAILNFNCKESTKQVAEEVVTELEQAVPVSSTEQSKSVIDHHIRAFLANDLEAVVLDYTEESVVITPDTMVVGLEGVKSLFAGLFKAFPSESTTIETDKVVIENELVYLIWHGKSSVVEVPFGTDTFIIENDKIQRQTFSGIINPIE